MFSVLRMSRTLLFLQNKVQISKPINAFCLPCSTNLSHSALSSEQRHFLGWLVRTKQLICGIWKLTLDSFYEETETDSVFIRIGHHGWMVVGGWGWQFCWTLGTHKAVHICHTDEPRHIPTRMTTKESFTLRLKFMTSTNILATNKPST